MRKSRSVLQRAALAGAVAAAAASFSGTLAAGEYDPILTSCELRYNLKGWSFVVKRMDGSGTITCDNGQKADVSLKIRAGGLTAGKSEIIGGHGNFSKVRDIADLLGSYAHAEAHAGATASGAASVVTKGEVSLALAGTGKGVDLGIDFGAFTIEPRSSQ